MLTITIAERPPATFVPSLAQVRVLLGNRESRKCQILGRKVSYLVLHPSFVVVINVWIYSILRPVDFLRGTAFAIRPYNLAGGEKAAKIYLKDLEPGGTNGIFFAYEVNLVKKTCCGGFIYRTSDDVRS